MPTGDLAMKVKNLHVENFRGFEQLDFELPQDLVVLVGVNGSGKSSVLECIAILLSVIASRLTENRRVVGILGPRRRDMNVEADSTHVGIEISTKDSSLLPLSFSMDRSSRSGAKLNTNRGNLSEYIKSVHSSFINDSSRNLPLLVYYRTNRAIGDFYADNTHTYPQRFSSQGEPGYDPSDFSLANQLFAEAYFDAFTVRVNTFQGFLDWFKREEDIENEVRLRDSPDHRNRNLEVVRRAIESFLAEFPNAHFSNLRVIRTEISKAFGASYRRTENSRFIRPYFAINKNGKEVRLDNLSDGEKMLLMLVVDIARRLAILNPDEDEVSYVLSGEGVVLIDEVDLHLHPEWQRIVIPGLRKTFPKCQFIVTTHSPQVLSKVKRENIFILEDSQIWSADTLTYGRDSNSILSELMGVSERPIETKNRIDDCLRLIDAGNFQEASILLEELEDDLGTLDPDVVKARTLFSFLTRRENEENL